MAYSEELAQRTRDVLRERATWDERKMFGGLTFMVNGHMCCGIIGEELMVRVGPDAYEQALEDPNAREMDFTGRPLRGMVYVDSAGLKTQDQLTGWVRRGLEFALTLTPK